MPGHRLPRPTPVRLIATALIACAAAIILGRVDAPVRAHGLPELAIALGAERLVANGVALVVLVGVIAAHVARLTTLPRRDMAKAALPAALAGALLVPGASALAHIPAVIAIAIWAVARSRCARYGANAANDNPTPLRRAWSRLPQENIEFADDPGRYGRNGKIAAIKPSSGPKWRDHRQSAR